MKNCTEAKTLNTMGLQAAGVGLVVGSHVWLEDPVEAWVDGEVVEIKGGDIKVLCTSGKTVSAFVDTSQWLYLIWMSSSIGYSCQMLSDNSLFISCCHV